MPFFWKYLNLCKKFDFSLKKKLTLIKCLNLHCFLFKKLNYKLMKRFISIPNRLKKISNKRKVNSKICLRFKQYPFWSLKYILRKKLYFHFIQLISHNFKKLHKFMILENTRVYTWIWITRISGTVIHSYQARVAGLRSYKKRSQITK